MKFANQVMDSLDTTVFEVMSRLVIEHGSINLGQGFPDEDGPEDVRRAAADALMAGPNQYPPMAGLTELRQADRRPCRALLWSGRRLAARSPGYVRGDRGPGRLLFWSA